METLDFYAHLGSDCKTLLESNYWRFTSSPLKLVPNDIYLSSYFLGNYWKEHDQDAQKQQLPSLSSLPALASQLLEVLSALMIGTVKQKVFLNGQFMAVSTL